jgi:hypothetical protein
MTSSFPLTTRKLRRLMRRHEVTCGDIANIVGRHRVTVLNWHRGKPPPSKFVISYIEAHFARILAR